MKKRFKIEKKIPHSQSSRRLRVDKIASKLKTRLDSKTIDEIIDSTEYGEAA